ALERRHRVRYDPDREAQIAAHARSGRAAVVGRHAGNHDRVNTTCSQLLLEIGADEGTVHGFFDHRLAGQGRRLRLELSSRSAKQSVGTSAPMADVDDRGALPAPGGEQARDLALGLLVIALSPARVIEGHLRVDDDQRRGGHQRSTSPWMQLVVFPPTQIAPSWSLETWTRPRRP